MLSYFRAGITCLIIGSTLSLGSINSAHAKSPEPADTIKRVTKLLDDAERGSETLPRDERLRRARLSWRSTFASRTHPNAPLIRQLIANAICRQHAPSIRVAHRLDRYWGGRLFWYRESLIANAIASRQGLKIMFRAHLAIWQDKTLKEINKTRHVKHALNELSPAAAMQYTSSLYNLCRETAASSDAQPAAN